jgi:hypothetical protein
VAYPTRFESSYDLAQLPWFDVVDGRLVVDSGIPPAIDVHTHLALAYVVRQRLDLEREWPETEHYLPLASTLDLDVYANVNFSPGDLSKMKRDLTLGAVTAGGMRRTHTLPNLAREMKELGVVGSVLLAIDYPFLSDNAGDWLRAANGRDDFVVFGSVHPYKPHMERELDRQVALGARGIKVHPAVQTVLPSDRRAMKLYRACGRRGLPVLFHCGPVAIEPPLGRWLSQVRHYEKPLRETPETTFVLGHSGALQLDAGIELARSYDNVYVEIASQSLTGVRKILESVDPSRILFGSDWPFYHQSMPLAKLLIATEGAPELRDRILYRNAARLLGLSPEALLALRASADENRR